MLHLLLLLEDCLLPVMDEHLLLLWSQICTVYLRCGHCFVHHDGRLSHRRICWAGTTHHRSRCNMSHHWGGLC